MASPLKLLDFLVKREEPEAQEQESLQKSWPLAIATALMLGQAVDEVPYNAPPKLLAGFRQAGIVPPEERWKPEALHPELLPIAHLESSFGLKTQHEPCPGGEYHTAMGALGLKPVTAHEAYRQSKALQKEFPGLDDPKVFTNKLKDDNRFYNLAASAHWVQLKKIHGTPEKTAFAWRWGSGAAQKATPEQVHGDEYVKKYQSRMGQTVKKAWPKDEAENEANQPAFLSGHPGAGVARDTVLEATGATETPHGPENQAAQLSDKRYSWKRLSGQDRTAVAGLPHTWVAPMQSAPTERAPQGYFLPGQAIGTNPEAEARAANWQARARLAGRHPSLAGAWGQEPHFSVNDAPSQQVAPLDDTSSTGIASRALERQYWQRVDAMSRAGGKGVTLSRLPIKKSIQDLKPSTKQLGEGVWDYSHLLTPEERAQGLSMSLIHRVPKPHVGNPSLTVLLQEADKTGKLQERGHVSAYVQYQDHLMSHSELDDKFRGRGLGARMYLAAFAHAYHRLGIRHISGGYHSEAAGQVHQSFKRRYGWNYRPDEGMEGGTSPETALGPYGYTLKNELSKTDCDLWLAQQTLVKAVKPAELKSVSRYDDHALGEVFVNDEFEPDSHPHGNDVFAQAFRHHVVEDPKPVKRGKTGNRESSNSTGKVVYDIRHPIGEHGDTHRFMVKPYHEKIVPRCRAWQEFPIQGWAELTNQALYHAGEIGHLHQRVHVDRLPMAKTGRRGVPEQTIETPALIVHMQPGVKTVEYMGSRLSRALEGGVGSPPTDQEIDARTKVQQQARQIWLFDFLSNNLDRHWSNLLYDEKNGNLLAIDHSRSFQYKNHGKDPVDHRNIPRGQYTDSFGNYEKLGLQQVMDSRNPYWFDESHPGYNKPEGTPEGKEYKQLRENKKWQAMDAWNQKWNPTFEWWDKVKDQVVDTWKKRLGLIKEKAVREHLDRNFMERVKLLNDYAKFGIDNFGQDDWDETPVTMFRYGKRDHED